MNQTKTDSVLESITNILIGAFIALLSQLLIFPIMDKDFTLSENIILTFYFTIISFARSYYIRRSFNGRSVYFVFKEKFLND